MAWRRNARGRVASRMKPSTLAAYHAAARTLATERGVPLLRAWTGLLRHRIRTGKGPPLYLTYRLFEKPVDSWAEYLDSREMIALEMEINPREHWPLVDNKLWFFERCRAAGLPTPPVLAVIGQDEQVEGVPVLDNAMALEAFFRRADREDYVLKRNGGAYGQGFFLMRWTGTTFVNLANGASMDASSLFETVADAPFPYLVQPRLRRAAELGDVMPGEALGTVRVVTVVDRKHEVLIPYAFIKLPVSGQVLDNFSHGQSGNLLCGIDVPTGRMMSAFRRPRGRTLLEKVTRHPETGAQIEGRPVPFWPAIQALCTTAALAFPELRTLGWDVAITDHGLSLIEANKTYDPDGMQITLERGIRSELTKLYRA
jgi:hypothetical protein